MRALTLVTGLLSLVSGSIAVHGVFESLRAVPSGWKQLGAPSPDTRIHLRIALKKPNQDLFEKTLFAVSTPDHPKYGQHLKREELKAMLKPATVSTDAFSHGLKNRVFLLLISRMMAIGSTSMCLLLRQTP